MKFIRLKDQRRNEDMLELNVGPV